jgi:hypothetical protein
VNLRVDIDHHHEVTSHHVAIAVIAAEVFIVFDS